MLSEEHIPARERSGRYLHLEIYLNGWGIGETASSPARYHFWLHFNLQAKYAVRRAERQMSFFHEDPSFLARPTLWEAAPSCRPMPIF